MREAYYLNERILRGSTRVKYEYPQPLGPVEVGEYLLFGERGSKSCLLRFKKNEDIEIEYIVVDILEKNGEGQTIAKSRHSFDREELSLCDKGEMFSPSCALRIDDKCSDVKVRLVEICTEGGYIYRLEGGKLVADYPIYEPWAYETAKQGAAKKGKFSARSKLGKRTHLVFPCVILTMVFITELVLQWHLLQVVPIELIKTTINDGLQIALEAVGEVLAYVFSFEFIGDCFILVGDLFEMLFEAISNLFGN